VAITASLVKELRERTGAGMMECKKALVECDGDIEAAADLMRKSGAAKADKKSGRVAADGTIKIQVSDDGKKAVIVEVNSETDFVAKDDNFQAFAKSVADAVFENEPADVDVLSGMKTSDGQTVEQAREELVSKIGENIKIRRFQIITSDDSLVSYQHGARIGVVVDSSADNDMAKDIAMHIAAVNPQHVDESEVPEEIIQKEKDILKAQSESTGKPAEIIEKMIQGRIKKFLAEITLTGQPFVKDPDQTVGKLLSSANAKVNGFVRFEVGEGIEKKQEDFAAEVMAQVKG
jgi:elongation factor Ts